MEGLTLNDLKVFVDQAINEGHGDKTVHLSNDDEGNGYHTMYYAVTPLSEEDAAYLGLDPNKDITLG